MTDVEAHYAGDAIAPRILAALEPGVAVTPETLAPLDQFHGRGLAATRELAALLAPQADEHVLDIGCGIGGPARWLAAQFGCRVTGIDLTASFCRAAAALNQAAELAERVRIVHASALALPFATAAFDRAWSQNVAMNIADKAAFYAEAWRVLRPGGAFALSIVCAGPAGPPDYPVPWAGSAETSFLATPAETRAAIAAAGFEVVELRDTTPAALAEQAAIRARPADAGAPALGLHVLMGERIRLCRSNSGRAIADGRLVPLDVLARKPR